MAHRILGVMMIADPKTFDEMKDHARRPGTSRLVYEKRRRTIIVVRHSRLKRFWWSLKSLLSGTR
jgi:hypothetical protein